MPEPPVPEPPVPMKRWKRVEYERLVDQGVFGPDDRIELIDGLLLVAEPQSSSHYTAIQLVTQALTRAFGEGWTVRSQAPIALDEASEPEPDVAVVRGGIRDFATAHPVDPVLVVEVSLSSLTFDREHKASLYARAGRPEYWIVNLLDRVLEIRRDPAPEPSAPYGWDYAFVDVLGPTARAPALAVPAAQILVGDLLP
jgi:Uma2 family endonuclease